ncbi:MAG: YifB family Mg chelatase-like AAA ATPase [Spirochaetota bacterium]
MTILSYAPGGYHGHIVTVEVDCRLGIPGMDIVGLPASEVREARERARVAIRNSGFEFPQKRILVNLSPADVPKIGNGFDLSIAAAILASAGQLRSVSHEPVMVIGELHLDGTVGSVRGVLAAVAEGADNGVAAFVVPATNVDEARAVAGDRVAGIGSLSEMPVAIDRIATDGSLATDCEASDAWDTSKRAALPAGTGALTDYAQLRGLSDVKRVLEIAVAGLHHVLVVGPPGAGKSAAMSLVPTIQPPLSRREAVEVTRIHSLAAEPGRPVGLLRHRPFRAPHHNTSTEGLLGGRLPQIPGEVALAHCGTLFLDEALEFRRPVLQGLREPLEHRRVRVARARGNYWFPAALQLILATNRCPCGMLGRRDRVCLCSVSEVDRYWRKLGGPLLDRIDLRLPVAPKPLEQLPPTDSSGEIASRVRAAVAYRRSTRGQGVPNACLTAESAQVACSLTAAARSSFAHAAKAFGLSTRASLSVLRVARTIADIAETARVDETHVLEAVSYRRYGEVRPLWEADDS